MRCPSTPCVGPSVVRRCARGKPGHCIGGPAVRHTPKIHDSIGLCSCRGFLHGATQHGQAIFPSSCFDDDIARRHDSCGRLVIGAAPQLANLPAFRKDAMLKRTLWSLFLLALLIVLHPQPVDAIPIVSVGSATEVVGDTFTIPVSITDAEDLASWQFNLSFGPTILQVTATGVTESNFFTQGDITVFVPGFVDNALGHIFGVADALIFQPAVNGSGVLAYIEFTANAAGVSPLTLSNVFLNLSDSGFAVTNGSVCVNAPTAQTCQTNPAPEPSTLPLLAIGLLALGAWRPAGRAWRIAT
jgi:hypothetical protein